MKKTVPVQKWAIEAGGEHVLGLKDLGTHACYLIYGELAPGEAGRKVCPGAGHEEILMAVAGDLQLTGEYLTGWLREGEAMHFQEQETCLLANPSGRKVVYVLAGGHSGIAH